MTERHSPAGHPPPCPDLAADPEQGTSPDQAADLGPPARPGHDDSLGQAADPVTHRGGFGDLGGGYSGLIDRAFRERIVLVGVTGADGNPAATDDSLDELSLLVDTAGADAVERIRQRRRAPDPATFVGSGKALEIKDAAERTDCDTVVFDEELTPAQQFNLEKLLGRTALDRTAVILDIFAQNASTPEGKAQVELAQLRYRLPRLRGSGRRLSQQAGGIGTRGPGETRLETDRRRLVRRVHKLEAELRTLEQRRRTRSKSRRRSRNRAVALVGYTNAGKSALLNRLTGADAAVEDRLFCTLDTTTRKLELDGGETVLVSDTVGFVRKLPHQLVEAFKTTLDVVRDADLLLHVVDGAAADMEGSVAAVRRVLAEIGAGHLPEILVVNKCDLWGPAALAAGAGGNGWGRDRGAEPAALPDPTATDADGWETGRKLSADAVTDLTGHDRRVANRFGIDADVSVSALTGAGIDELRQIIGDRLRSAADVVELMVPWSQARVLAGVHREGQVLTETAEEQGMRLRARLEPASIGPFRDYIV